jgi:phosphatidylglycerophosphate synthase
MLVADHTIEGPWLWAAIVILCREILVSGLREFLAELHVSVPVSTVAKWKTAMQLFSLGFLIVGDDGKVILPQTIEIGLWLLAVAAVLTLYTGYDYFRVGFRHVVELDGQ